MLFALTRPQAWSGTTSSDAEGWESQAKEIMLKIWPKSSDLSGHRGAPCSERGRRSSPPTATTLLLFPRSVIQKSSAACIIAAGSPLPPGHSRCTLLHTLSDAPLKWVSDHDALLHPPTHHRPGLPHVACSDFEQDAAIFPRPHDANKGIPQQPTHQPQTQPFPLAERVCAASPHDITWMIVNGKSLLWYLKIVLLLFYCGNCCS